MGILCIGLATLIILLWLMILLVWFVSFGRTLQSEDAWPDSSVLTVSEKRKTVSVSSQTAA